jgi:hypothetical protein
MSEMKFGELASWEDADVNSGGNDFMALKEGANQVRIFTNPFQFVVHWVKDASGSNRKVKCAIQNCPVCKQGIKSQTRWFLGVIERSTQCCKILEISSQIYNGIKNNASDPDWGNPSNYDINIIRGPKGSQPLYTVTPKPQKPLLADEKVSIKNFLERVDLSKFTQPPTPNEVLEKVGNNFAPNEESSRPLYGGSQVAAAPQPRPEVNDDNFDFGDDDD